MLRSLCSDNAQAPTEKRAGREGEEGAAHERARLAGKGVLTGLLVAIPCGILLLYALLGRAAPRALEPIGPDPDCAPHRAIDVGAEAAFARHR